MPFVRKRLRSSFKTPPGSPVKKSSPPSRTVLHSPRPVGRPPLSISKATRNSANPLQSQTKNKIGENRKRPRNTSIVSRQSSSALTSTPEKQKKVNRNPRKALFSTSPRKTRALQKREDDSGDDEIDCKCEACGQARPLDQLRNCPNCVSIFHMTCLQLEPENLRYFNANRQKWRCPRCITCAKCSEYIHDPGNVQCIICGKVCLIICCKICTQLYHRDKLV